MKVLLFHDDLAFAYKIKTYFERKNINIDILYGYDSILSDIENIDLFKYDAFVFQIEHDILEGLDMLEYLKLLHISSAVIFISDTFSLELLSFAFARNADDYIGGSFEIKELELRLVKAIRKSNITKDIHFSNDYVFNYIDSSISFGYEEIELTNKQQRLLLLLIKNKNKTVTYEMIQQSVYGGDYFSNNALASHVRDIRKKIKNILIKSVRGIGYKLIVIECIE